MSGTLPTRRDSLRHTLHRVIFEADTPGGKAFDVALFLAIGASVAAVMLESVPEVRAAHGGALRIAEWTLTVLFTVEYLVRLVAVGHPWRYARSFFGVVDLLAVVPTYVSLVFPGAQSLLVLRAIRLLRVFRVFKLARYLHEAGVLLEAMRSSRRKITVFFGTVLVLVLIIGALMYLVEGERSGFTSIPKSVYWAIVTVTTVGYGDITPRTALGQFIAAVAMLLGYSIIAVPTGIFGAELMRQGRGEVTTRACRRCGAEGHDRDALYCKRCGAGLADPATGAQV